MSLTIEEIQEIQEKIENAKQEKAKSEGAVEQIKQQWKTEYELNSLEEVENEIKELNDQVNSLIEKYDNCVIEIEKVMETT